MGDQQAANLDQFVKKTARKTVSSPPLFAAKAAAVAMGSRNFPDELLAARIGLNQTPPGFKRRYG